MASEQNAASGSVTDQGWLAQTLSQTSTSGAEKFVMLQPPSGFQKQLAFYLKLTIIYGTNYSGILAKSLKF